MTLTALMVAACAPAVGSSQYAPQWHVGDWWMVSEQMPRITGRGWHLQTNRYDVLGIEKVNGRDCFVLQRKFGDTTSAREGVRFLYYIRTDNWRVIRMGTYLRQAGEIHGPGVSNYPDGMRGFHPFGAWFPLFPLDTATVQDSAFHLDTLTYGAADLRQFSGIADTALLNRYLSGADSSGARPVQPRGGAMFSVLSEVGVPRDSIIVPVDYNLQLWSRNYPWRLYEEWGQYEPEGSSIRQARSRSWLVRCGHTGK
jgi:hypothetical protein